MRRRIGVAAAAVVLIASGCGSPPEPAPATVTVTSLTSSPQGTAAPVATATSTAEAPAVPVPAVPPTAPPTAPTPAESSPARTAASIDPTTYLGGQLANAEAALKKLGYTRFTYDMVASDKPAGTVLSVSPSGAVPFTEVVTLRVSTGVPAAPRWTGTVTTSPTR